MGSEIKKTNYAKSGSISKTITFMLLLLFLLARQTCVLADTVSIKDRKMGKYVIRQQMCKRGSILTVQPVAVDLKILSIINEQSIESVKDYELWLQENKPYALDWTMRRYEAVVQRYENLAEKLDRARAAAEAGNPLPRPEELGLSTPEPGPPAPTSNPVSD